jgi:SAM-dependent methyltransferase
VSAPRSWHRQVRDPSGRDPSRRPSAAAESGVDAPFAFPPFSRARRVRAELVASILRGGRIVPDDTFDEIYPDAVRSVSPAHWTPVRVCARIVELLRLSPGARLLDVGAGAGKFCIVAAAMSRARVRGVEREPELAETAREAARRFGIDVSIDDRTFEVKDAQTVDAAYFFNPFTETMLLPGVAQEVPSDRFAGRAAEDVAVAEDFLRAARPGTRVVTYCGFGGLVPSDYVRLRREPWDGGALEVWLKRAVGNAQNVEEPPPTRPLASRDVADASVGGTRPDADDGG